MNEEGSPSTVELMALLRRGTDHLINMAKGMEIAWDPVPGDPRRVHNMYVRNLVTSYVSRFSELSNGVLIGLDNRDYLIYALCGRSLIETTATLRYYMLREYKPLLDRKTLVASDMKKLIDIDDRHLRGTGFDWESFVLRRYSRLRDRAKAKRGHKSSGGRGEPGAMPKQTPVGRCIDSWSKEVANVGVAYDLFCDMVHPSAGSSFLVASTSADGLYFSKFRGDPVGKAIVEQSLLLLLSITQKPFGQYLTMLMGTVWQDNEVE